MDGVIAAVISVGVGLLSGLLAIAYRMGGMARAVHDLGERVKALEENMNAAFWRRR